MSYQSYDGHSPSYYSPYYGYETYGSETGTGSNYGSYFSNDASAQGSASLLGPGLPTYSQTDTDTYYNLDPYGIRSMASRSRSAIRDMKAMQTLRDELQGRPDLFPPQDHCGIASWTHETLEQMASSDQASPEARAAAQRVLRQPELFEKMDNSLSGTATLNDGWFQLAELDATQERLQNSGMDYYYGAVNPLTLDASATYHNIMNATNQATA